MFEEKLKKKTFIGKTKSCLIRRDFKIQRMNVSDFIAFFCYQNTCSDNLMQCVKDNPTVTTKAKCLSAYAKCLKNKGPAKVALDPIEDMGQLEDFNGFVVSLCPIRERTQQKHLSILFVRRGSAADLFMS